MPIAAHSAYSQPDFERPGLCAPQLCGPQGAMEVVTEAVLTGGLAASGRVTTEGTAAGEVGASAPKEGIYEGPDATAPGKTYVGQSGDIPNRLVQHEASGKFAPGTKAATTEVKGGKTAREIAEHNRIQQLGGVKSKPGSQTSNIRNPIGKDREHLLKKEEKIK